MQLANAFKTSTAPDAATDGSRGDASKPGVSDFITVQSFTNFAAMTGAITVAWHAVSQVIPASSGIWFPYICAFAWAFISYLISRDGLVETSSAGKVSFGTSLQALFIGFLNALVLAGAVVGTASVTNSPPDQRQDSGTTTTTSPTPQLKPQQ